MAIEQVNDKRPVIQLDVFKCARCGQNHAKVAFKRLKRPVIDSDGTVWNYWAMCPETREPILMMRE